MTPPLSAVPGREGSVPTIGTPLWWWNCNRRRYDDNRRIIEREHWQPDEVVSETSRSWTTQGGARILKSDPLHISSVNDQSRGARVLWSLEDIDRAVWVTENRQRLAERVRDLRDYDRLQLIAILADDTLTPADAVRRIRGLLDTESTR